MNTELYALHTFFFYLLLIVSVALLVAAVAISRNGLLSGLLVGLLAGVFFAGIATLHRYAAKGARLGRNYGRSLSFAFACIWLVGFPIGTLLSIYVFTKIFKSWEVGVEDASPAH